MSDCPHNARIQVNGKWSCMACKQPTPPGCDMMKHQPGCGCTTAKDDATAAELVRLREALEWQTAVAKAALESQERLAEEVKELRKLAYIGEHHFPDLTWKARCEETVEDLRKLQANLLPANLIAAVHLLGSSVLKLGRPKMQRETLASKVGALAADWVEKIDTR